MINQVILEGRFYNDVENVKESSNGIKVLKFGILVPRGKNESPMFLNCIAFKFTAEYISRMGKKGNSFILSGQLDPQISKDNKQTGLQIIVNNMTIYPKINNQTTFDDEDSSDVSSACPWM